jgi:cell division protein FtsB
MILKKAVWPLGLVLVIIIIFLPSYTKIQELRDKNRDLAAKNRRLKIENALLEQEIKRIDTDQTYPEKILREKMGVVRKDEVPVKIIPVESRK